MMVRYDYRIEFEVLGVVKVIGEWRISLQRGELAS
jgi:hypothetical protein